jgi:hypothetical protein
MFRFPHKSVRVAMLVVMVVATVVSAARVLHAHSDGQQPHRLGTEHFSSLSHVATPVVWHAHVHLLGFDVHIPVGDEDDLDPTHVPGDLSPSWSGQPTVVDVPAVEAPTLEQSLDQSLSAIVSPPPINAHPPESERNSSITPGRLQRLLIASLTL